MLSISLDIINTICQAFLFTWCSNNIANKENKLSKVKFGILAGLMFAEMAFLTYSDLYDKNSPLANFYMFLIYLSLSLFFYRKSILDAFLGIGLGYSFIAFGAYLFVTAYQHFFSKLNLTLTVDIQLLLFVYIPIWVSYYFIYRYRKYIFSAARYLKSLKQSLAFVMILDYAIIFIDTLRMQWIYTDMGLVFKSILYLTGFITFVMALIYFAKVNDKSKEIELLNSALNEKITELKKVKHDYGSEISSLYGLMQLNRTEDARRLLKDIIDRNKSLDTGLSVNIQAKHPLVSSVLHTAASSGIDVVIADNGSYDSIAVSDKELLKLLSNIVKNSIDALGDVENPMIKFKSYNSYNGIIISIANNGPAIPEDIKNKIFETGFSTKENNQGDRGYGLSIVNDVIRSCNGKISVVSDKNWTGFNIEIPFSA